MVAALKINELVFHGIVRKTGPDAEAQLSEAVPALDGRALTFLQQQVADALRHGRQIVEEAGLSIVPDSIRAHWADDSDLLGCSRALAELLQKNQPSQSPAGLLMVADAVLDRRRTFVVAKLEHEHGAQATPMHDAQGRLIFSMEYLDQLIFTHRSRVYKIGCFPVGSDPVNDRLEGVVVDRQVSGHQVARYFREGFLGCTWRERPEVVTERFFDAAQAWIDTVDDPERRSRYQVALIAELQSPRDDLSVPEFANTRLEPGDRDGFVGHMRQSVSGLSLPKSIEFVRTRLANVRYDTESGVVVMAPPERLEDGTVTVEANAQGVSTLRVHDRIAKTSGYGTYRS